MTTPRRIFTPLPDVWVDHSEGNLTFHIKNDDPESSITSAMIQCRIEGGKIHEVLIGYFPPLPGDNNHSYWVIGRDKDPQSAELRKWLGVEDHSTIPFISFAYTQDSDLAREAAEYESEHPLEPWQKPFREMDDEGRDETRKNWLGNINAWFREKFEGLQLNEECQHKCEILLEEVFKRVEKRQTIPARADYIKNLFDPNLGWRRDMQDEE